MPQGEPGGQNVGHLFKVFYRKIPKSLNIRKFAVITLKVEQDGFSLE